MEFFYIAVLAIATGILILILTSVGVLIRKSNTEAPWPPTAGRCPDRWEESGFNKCIIPDSQNNSGLVTPYDSAGSIAAGYEKVSGWHVCGKAIISADHATTMMIIAEPGSNFNYFKSADAIKIVYTRQPTTADTSTKAEHSAIVKNITSTLDKDGNKIHKLILAASLPEEAKSPIEYSGKKISINFDTKLICEKRTWAKTWGIKWDGVSNYNKCTT